MSINSVPVIDLFAGPGGLNEGFSSVESATGSTVFETIGSFEMDATAVRTLTIRAIYRSLKQTDAGVPDIYYQFIQGQVSWEGFTADPRISAELAATSKHVHQVELGSSEDSSEETIRQALTSARALEEDAPWVLIGGPPCQAYSLAGRSRRANDLTFADDKKHFLYKEYLNIIDRFRPPVFVMENVKGLLSSTTSGSSMFARIKQDLELDGSYELHSLVSSKSPVDLKPSDFVIHAEEYGVPQRRHRVILVGIRTDYDFEGRTLPQLSTSAPVTVSDALAGVPALRSGISPMKEDGFDAWSRVRDDVIERYQGEKSSSKDPLSRGALAMERGASSPTASRFRDWILDSRLPSVIQHQSRSHMVSDLKRYWHAATSAAKNAVSPKLNGFPEELQPNHANAALPNRPFEDRFRVQVANKPSTTIVSHIAKDGHYYIHYDPAQMRSLTVREAARLQSFPDNYYFAGNRTQQYHQVGNAVPPLLAVQLAEAVAHLLGRGNAPQADLSRPDLLPESDQ